MNYRLTLVVDGNWLLMSRVSVLRSKYKNDQDRVFTELPQLLTNSIRQMVNTFEFTECILVCDGGSWRKKLPKPNYLSEEVYKSNRVHTDEFDWSKLYKVYDKWQDQMSKYIPTYKEYGIEGDDWCWFWSTKLNETGNNCMIWSTDKDLTQLVRSTKDSFTVCYNGKNIIVDGTYKYDEMDFFFSSAEDTFNIYNSLFGVAEEKRINPYEVVVDKILHGDVSDNILPILVRRKNDRNYKISKGDMVLDIDVFNSEDYTNYIKRLYDKYSTNVVGSVDDALEHYKYNRRLVYLDRRNYPENILRVLDDYDLPDTFTESLDGTLRDRLENAMNDVIGTRNNIDQLTSFL